MAEKYYITTAIAYTSGKPHIGNTYEIVLSDFLARFKRKQGFDVFFQTGTDEHGEKIEQRAAAAGLSPKAFVDKIAGDIKNIWDMMNTSYDKFIRTTDRDHEEQIQKMFETMLKNDDIYKGAYKGWYCTPCESFWTESQLVDGKCPDCGREVKLAEEEAYFFRMSKYADRLIQYYDEHPDFILPISRKNEMVNNFLKPGLQDLCVSRTSFTWGIPVKSDPKHVVYVWLDALSNYITGIGYNCGGKSSAKYKKYWPADVHVIGKDIVRFHTIYWPIFLMALGEPLPKQVFGHPWLLQEGGKMSKSRGNVIYADDLVKYFGVDAVRYYVLSEMPYDNDGVITWELVLNKVNSDLANVLGNLVNRTIAMSNKYFGGKVENKNVIEDVDADLKAVVTGVYVKVAEKVSGYRIADALGEVMAIFRRANKYIDETAPWVLARDEGKQDRLATVLYNLTESIVIGTTLLESFLPETAARIFKQLSAKARKFEELSTFGLLKSGARVTDTPEILFARMDEKILMEVEAMYAERKAKAEAEEAQNCGASSKNGDENKMDDKKIDNNADKNQIMGNERVNTEGEITIDDFKKVQLRVGKILTAEKVEKSDKLLKFSVEVGEEVRTIVSGIAQYYTAEEMVGKQVVVVANLKPAKLRGIMSEGMLLCADNGEDVILVSPEKPVASGSEVR